MLKRVPFTFPLQLNNPAHGLVRLVSPVMVWWMLVVNTARQRSRTLQHLIKWTLSRLPVFFLTTLGQK